jgi:hypothetical protein
MDAMVQFAVLTVATVLAVAAALGLNWFFLRAAFYLMQPAAVRPRAAVAASVSGSELVYGARAVARQFAAQR